MNTTLTTSQNWKGTQKEPKGNKIKRKKKKEKKERKKS
jgi:hypothetical protein